MSVLFYHVGFRSFTGGYVGVDVFFVISGFLITRLIRSQVASGTFRFSEFYVRRARRLLPALLVTTVVTAGAAVALLSPVLLKEFGGSVVFTSLSLANVFFFQQSDYFDSSAISKPLLHAWSLGVEEQFYLVWPAIIVLVLKPRTRRYAPFVVLTLGAASLAMAGFFRAHDEAVFYLTPFRAFEFVFGALVVWLQDRPLASNAVKETGLLTGLMLIIGSALGFGTSTYSALSVVVPCIGAALVLHCGTAATSGRLLRNPVAVGIGRISYSLYLVHWPIIVFLRYVRFEEFDLTEQWLLIVAAFAAAIVLYRFVEQPFRHRAGGTGLFSDRRFLLGYSGALVAVVAVAAIMWRSDGWLWRYPDSIRRQIDVAAIERDKAYTWRGFVGANRPFGEGDKRKVLLIGDSQGADFFNMLSETGRTDVFDISTIKLDMQCQSLISFSAEEYDRLSAPDRSSCAAGFASLTEDDRISGAEVVLLALNWDDRGIPHIQQAVRELRRRGGRRVIVVGRKAQGYSGPDVMLRYGMRNGIEAFSASRKNPIAWDANARIHALGSSVEFLDVMSHVCPTPVACRVLTTNKDVIFFDASHFTPEGARFIGSLLMEAGAFEF